MSVEKGGFSQPVHVLTDVIFETEFSSAVKTNIHHALYQYELTRVGERKETILEELLNTHSAIDEFELREAVGMELVILMLERFHPVIASPDMSVLEPDQVIQKEAGAINDVLYELREKFTDHKELLDRFLPSDNFATSDTFEFEELQNMHRLVGSEGYKTYLSQAQALYSSLVTFPVSAPSIYFNSIEGSLDNARNCAYYLSHTGVIDDAEFRRLRETVDACYNQTQMSEFSVIERAYEEEKPLDLKIKGDRFTMEMSLPTNQPWFLYKAMSDRAARIAENQEIDNYTDTKIQRENHWRKLACDHWSAQHARFVSCIFEAPYTRETSQTLLNVQEQLRSIAPYFQLNPHQLELIDYCGREVLERNTMFTITDQLIRGSMVSEILQQKPERLLAIVLIINDSPEEEKYSDEVTMVLDALDAQLRTDDTEAEQLAIWISKRNIDADVKNKISSIIDSVVCEHALVEPIDINACSATIDRISRIRALLGLPELEENTRTLIRDRATERTDVQDLL